jgi:hypothetical protein
MWNREVDGDFMNVETTKLRYGYSKLRSCFNCEGTGYFPTVDGKGSYEFVCNGSRSSLIKCEYCNGTTKIPIIGTIKRVPKWMYMGWRLIVHHGFAGDWNNFCEVFKCAFLYDLGWPRYINKKHMN